jgi:hypothetical protein
MSHIRPTDAYTPDMPMCELRSAELFLTSAFRLYASVRIDPGRQWPDWRQGFVAAGIAADGVPAFERLFEIVTAVPLRPLNVRCVFSHYLSVDEGRLLQMVGLLQRRGVEQASALLGEWVPEAAVRLAMPSLQNLAYAMATVGLTIPPRLSAPEPLPAMTAPAGEGPPRYLH